MKLLSLYKSRNAVQMAVLLLTVSALTCSMPNLEPPECSESRNTVKEFYSAYFGNEFKLPAGFQIDRFLSPAFRSASDTRQDPYTLSDVPPKAFRVGECSVTSPGRTRIQVLLFWRDDTRSQQNEIFVETVSSGDEWRIENISK